MEGTIENKVVDIELILKTFKNKSDRKSIKEIKASISEMFLDNEDIFASSAIDNQVEEALKQDRKLGDESYLVYDKSKRKYRVRPSARIVDDSISSGKINPIYLGTAGECAVMSELIFAGYNANRMMIDEGVDIIAVKDNIYYYIQVKTTFVKDGRMNWQIGLDRYSEYLGAQIRYILVARYNENGVDKNVFFTFNSQEIDKEISQNCIKRGENTISIKIRFDIRTGKPVLYDTKECDCTWNMNRFKL